MQQNRVIGGVLAVACGLAVTAVYARAWLPPAVFSSGMTQFNSDTRQLISSASQQSDTTTPEAPEFASGTWINSEPLTIKGLAGRVVLVEFWTYGCYNCRNTLPFVRRWHERYSDKGLTIVGVHSPEFAGEKSIENVRREVASLDIRFPVVTDNDHETWRAYKVEAWPTIFVIDKSGRVRWKHVGEGAYEETERTIQKLMAENERSTETKKN